MSVWYNSLAMRVTLTARELVDIVVDRRLERKTTEEVYTSSNKTKKNRVTCSMQMKTGRIPCTM